MAGIRLSLLTPSGSLTLGNLLGALLPMVRAADGPTTTFYGLSDLHAMTVPHDPVALRARTQELMIMLVAAGLDPDRATLFRQSEVPQHTELAYLLECTAHIGELNRMIQYKQKGRGRPTTRASLFTYPVLMAADILLYRPDEVPVGDDQRQHVELTRDLAIRFNREYGEVFTVPQVVSPSVGARVMNLLDPTTKMGKSATDGAGIVYLLDPPDVVARKISRAVTDSESGPDAVRHDPSGKPGVSNLLEITAGCTGRPVAEVAASCATYGQLKQAATVAVLELLGPIRLRYDALRADPSWAARYADGAARCRQVSAPVVAAARSVMGLDPS